MIKKRNKFFTVIFSFLPGAAHMYMGFFKMGISLMTAFFLLCAIASWLSLGPLLFIAPVLWFYSFFDAINKMSLSDEEFYSLEDRYLLHLDSLKDSTGNKFFTKNKLYFGIAFILLGIYLFFRQLSYLLYYLFPDEAYAIRNLISAIIDTLPQLVITGVIIFIGVRLIVNRKSEGSDK